MKKLCCNVVSDCADSSSSSSSSSKRPRLEQIPAANLDADDPLDDDDEVSLLLPVVGLQNSLASPLWVWGSR